MAIDGAEICKDDADWLRTNWVWPVREATAQSDGRMRRRRGSEVRQQ